MESTDFKVHYLQDSIESSQGQTPLDLDDWLDFAIYVEVKLIQAGSSTYVETSQVSYNYRFNEYFEFPIKVSDLSSESTI